MSHTSGPWIQYDGLIFEARGIQRHIALIVKSGVESQEREHANAHLISAAPEMYDILQGIITMHMLDGSPRQHQFLIDDIERVLKKARGE